MKTWMLYAEREGATPTPMEWKSVGFEEYFPKHIYGHTKIRVLAFWQGKHLTYYMNKDDINAIDHYAFRHFLRDDKYLQALRKATVDSRSKLQVFSNTINLDTFAHQSIADLAKMFERLAKLYKYSFGAGFIGALGGKSLQKYVSAQIKEKGGSVSDIAALTQPQEESLFVQANKELEQLAHKQETNKKDLDNYLKKYSFIGYDYAGPALTKEKLKEHIKEVRHQPRQQQKNDYRTLQRKLKLSREQKRLCATLAELGYLKELRNTTDDLAHYKLDLLLDVIGKRFNLTRHDLRYYRSHEIIKLLTTNHLLPQEELQLRKQAMVMDNTTNPPIIYTGQAAIDYHTRQIPQDNLAQTKHIKGRVAQPGKVTGIVRIIQTVSAVPRFQGGEVLVSPMTSPAYMPAIRKAAAIVTNEGGMTSHAAIISREFGIPCIVGTKVATKIFKNGDTIEVDANKGIVRKL